MHWAVLNGHVQAISVLVDAGGEANAAVLKAGARSTRLRQETPLHIGVRVHGADSEVVRLLLSLGGDLDAMDGEGLTVRDMVAAQTQAKEADALQGC